MSCSLDAQLAACRLNLHTFNKLKRLGYLLGIAAFLLFATYVVTRHEVALPVSVLFSLAAFTFTRTLETYRQALAALAGEKIKPGKIDIQFAGVQDSTKRPICQAVLHEASGSRWTLEFIPQGWQPQAGEFTGSLHYLEGSVGPLAATVSDGVILPRARPRRQG